MGICNYGGGRFDFAVSNCSFVDLDTRYKM